MALTVKYSVDRNFGDAVNDLVFPFFVNGECLFIGPAVKPRDGETTIMGIGSIMQYCGGTEICGSGIIALGSGIATPKCIHWVRGPLTRDLLLKKSIPCPPIYGDAALLLPFILTPTTTKKHRLGFIPHYIDPNTDGAKQIIEAGAHYIDIKNYKSYQSFIDEINSCKYIISSSLHGIIVSDAYNIPAYHVKLSNRVMGGEFKFRDYYASVGREYFDIQIGTIDEMVAQFKPYKCEIDLTNPLKLMPKIDPTIQEESLNRLNNGFMDYIHKEKVVNV